MSDGSYRADGFPLKLREVTVSRRYYRLSSTDFHFDTSVVDPDLSGSVGREPHVDSRVLRK